MPFHPPPYAKLNPPQTAHIISRERLFSRLDQLQQSRVVWVCGPPGAGKTALIASYLTARSMSCLWYQVDSGDADVSTFFYYLREAVISRFPKATCALQGKRSLQLLTPEYLGDFQNYSRRFFRQLYATYPENSVLVFDNFQESAGSQPFCDAVHVALSEVPPQFCAIVISRFDPPDIFAKMCANRSIEMLSWNELKFTADEMKAIASDLTDIDQSLLATLLELTQGWVAGFVLMLEYIRQKGSARLPQAMTIAHQALFDYFTGEIFAALSEDTRDSLLRLGMFTSFTGQSARRITGLKNIELVLERLIQQRLFINRINEPRRYEFHPLFRDFLCAQASKIWTEQDLKTIRKQAAHLSEQEGSIDAAFGLFAEASDWHQLIRLINRQAADMLAHGRYKTLAAWIGVLPAYVVAKQPWMQYWKAVTELPFTPALSRAELEKANALFKSDNDITGRFLTCAIALRSFFYEWSDFHGVDAWLPEMEELYSRYGTSLPPEIEAQVYSSGLGILYRQPCHPLLPIWADRARQLVDKGYKPDEQTPISDFVIAFYLHQGNFDAGYNVLNGIRKSMSQNETPPVTLIGLETWSSIHAFLTADHESAYRHIENALAIADQQGIHVFDALIYGQLVYTQLSEGKLCQADSTLQRMETLTINWRRMDAAFIYHLRSGLCMRRGDAAGALRAAKAAMDIAETAGALLLVNHCRIGLIDALITLEDFDAAKKELNLSRDFAERMPNYIFGFCVLLAESHLALRHMESTTALHAVIRKAFAHGRKYGYMNAHPFWLPDVMSELCAIALEHGIETDYVIRLIRNRGLEPPQGMDDVWPWPVKIYTLGRFSLDLEDAHFRHSGKMQKKTLDLLKAIVALGGRNIANEKLSDLFWPEAEGCSARSAFDMALHRLRKLLGHDDAILLSEGKVTLNPACCWVDVWNLERLLNEIEGLLKMPSINESLLEQLTEKVLHLYQGAFLGGDCDQTWAFIKSEKLRQKLLRQIKSVGLHWQGEGQFNKAAALFERFLEQDPLTEEFYRLLMLCHDAAGNRSEALNTYDRCRKILARISGAAPSEAIEMLYRQLGL